MGEGLDVVIDLQKDRLAAAFTVMLVAVVACQAPIQTPALVEVDQAVVETSVASTMSAAETESTRAVSSSTVTPAPSSSPSSTPTITPTSPPSALLSRDTNCRTGPLRVYDLITTILTGQEVRILGKNPEETYWYIEDASATDGGCWLWGRYAEARGALSAVPVFTPPPTPTPTSIWSGEWVVWVDNSLAQASMELSQSGDSISGTLTGEAAAYSISAVQGEGGQTVSGEFGTSQTGTFPFSFSWMMLDSGVQFVGNFAFESDNISGFPAPFCGARPGDPMPDPCQWP